MEDGGVRAILHCAVPRGRLFPDGARGAEALRVGRGGIDGGLGPLAPAFCAKSCAVALALPCLPFGVTALA